MFCREEPGEGEELHLHHRPPQAEGGGNTPVNLVPLCANCHNRHHRSVAAGPALVTVDADAFEYELTSVDKHVIRVVRQDGPLKIPEIADQLGVTAAHVRSRLMYL